MRLLLTLVLLSALGACALDARAASCPEASELKGAALLDEIERASRGGECRLSLLRALDASRGEGPRTSVERGGDEDAEVASASVSRMKHSRESESLSAELEAMEAQTMEAQTMEAQAMERALADFTSAAERAPIVVLDPGHGGNEYGATADGLRESHLTLDLAKRIALKLRAMNPELDIRLTRDGDYRVSLPQRAELANASGADLFVSIHLNDAKGEIHRGGVTAFVLDAFDEKSERPSWIAERVARENGMSLEEVSELSVLLARLDRSARVEASLRLAESVHRGALRGGRKVLPRLHDRGVRRAAFQVLIGAKMPAVLLEASFINVPDERDALKTERYKDALAGGVALGILDYLYPTE